jgi:hypothetical protein
VSNDDDVFGFGRAMSEAVRVNVGAGLWLIIFGGVVATVAAAFIMSIGRR